MTARPLHVELDLELSGGDIRGSLSGGGGEPLAFVGWLGLVGAIHASARRSGSDEIASAGALLEGEAADEGEGP